MSNLFIPDGCKPLSSIKEIPQIRLGLQGAWGGGKTWAALTFPNPTVVNLDRGLGAHIGRSDVVEVPLYDDAYCKTIDPNYNASRKKELIVSWLERYANKFQPNQTLVWDGNTPTQNAYHVWFEANKHRFLTRDGKVNEFAEWNQKVPYYSAIFDIFKSMKCHIVFICHEVDRPDKGNIGDPKKYSGKIRPLMTGQMGDELGSHFTDWFRQCVASKPADFNAIKEEDCKRLWKMTKAEFKAMCDTFKGESIYFWQTEGDEIFDAKASSLVEAPRFIPANYSSFEKYRRKVQTT